MAEPTHTNRLIDQTSPYLLQHAHNPVDWYPWGEEAFARAKSEDKPVLLSIGYSACHWCHVMERESFENESIAARMNSGFINIKVDREERPDIDTIYMSAVQMMTGQGGWPMTMFLTPEGKPFFGGTYFPPDDLYGRPGFTRVLEAVKTSWKTQRIEIEEQSQDILKNLDDADFALGTLTDTLLTSDILDRAYTQLSTQFDRHNGGFGSAPKFPQPANLDFLLRYHYRSKQQEPLAMVERTLQKMALGGIYDQLGGGFHRYSTDHTWLVPHFEKMLYDNAQLAQLYCRAYQATEKSFYKGVAEETLEYVLREMTAKEGGFYSAQDADSEGEEGKFFVWTPAEISAVLGKRDAAVFSAFYDISPGGNWEGNNILHVVKDAQEVARQFGLTLDVTAAILDGGRAKLLEEREERIHPGLDDKILTSWNGLMLAAFAECSIVFERADFKAAAVRNAEFIISAHARRDETGRFRLLRTSRNGAASLNGYLEDYSFFADGLLWLYEATFEIKWLKVAEECIDTMLALFWDEDRSGFFATSSDHEKLIQRPKDWDDNATPSGNSLAIEVMLRYAALTGEEEYRGRAVKTLRKLGSVIEKHPYGFARVLGALDFHLSSVKEIAIIGDPTLTDTKALLRVIYKGYLPNKVVALADKPISPDANTVMLLSDKPMRGGKPTAYVCENFTCKEPVTTPAELGNLLS